MSGFDNLFDIQKNMASRLAREVEMDRSVELLSMIQSLIPDRQGRYPMDAIVVEASYNGFSEEDVLRLLQGLKRDRTLKLTEGYVIL